MASHYVNCPGGGQEPADKQSFPTHIEFGRTVLGKGICIVCNNLYAVGRRGLLRRHDRHIIIPDRVTDRQINDALVSLVHRTQNRIAELEQLKMSVNYPQIWHAFQKEFTSLPVRMHKERDAEVDRLVELATTLPGSTGAGKGDSP